MCIRDSLRATLTLFVPTIATTIYTALDKTMLNNITGSMTENGYYEPVSYTHLGATSINLSVAPTCTAGLADAV